MQYDDVVDLPFDSRSSLVCLIDQATLMSEARKSGTPMKADNTTPIQLRFTNLLMPYEVRCITAKLGVTNPTAQSHCCVLPLIRQGTGLFWRVYEFIEWMELAS